MPCQSGPSPAQEIKAREDALARLLCDTLKIVELHPDTYRLLPSNVQAWHKKHKKEDEKREAQERKNQEAKDLLFELEDDPAVKAYLALKKKVR